ncbi:MAG TPA: AgmX/PglI C-terminal domain-containing protein [Kofleriaceae bacterium]|nr:AgmX/PglI C-terminal domain-containing protein [Kofleriaceae bacterium]
MLRPIMLGVSALVALASCSNGNASPAPSAAMVAPPIIPTATPIRAQSPDPDPAATRSAPDESDDLEMPADLVQRRGTAAAEASGGAIPAPVKASGVRSPILSDQLLLDDGAATPPAAEPVVATRAPEPAAAPPATAPQDPIGDRISDEDRALIEAATAGPAPTEMIARREPTVAGRPSAPARAPAAAPAPAAAEPTPASTARSTVTFGPTTSMSVSSLSPTDVRKTIQRSFLTGIRACHAQALASDPTLSGTVTVQINVGPDGQIAIARAFGFSTAVDTCLKAAARGWQFEIPRDAAGQPTTAPFKIELRLAPA